MSDYKIECLFAYGTLIFAEIMAEVVGFRPQGSAAVLGGFRRFRLRNEQYPAIVPAREGRVEGMVYRGIGESAWRRLDRFEGEIYERKAVQVVMAGGEVRPAATYILRPEFMDRLEAAEWDPASFAQREMARFLQHFRGWTGIRKEND